MKCENRTMTETRWNRSMSFSKEYLDEIEFGAGKYEVTYDKDGIIIKRIIIEKKPKLEVKLTKDDIQRIEKDKNQKIELYIQKGFTKEDALIDISYGFPIIQLIKYQNGKCSCGANLNVPDKDSPKEAYQGLSHQAMKFEDNRDNYNIIGFDHGYKLYCEKCSGI